MHDEQTPLSSTLQTVTPEQTQQYHTDLTSFESQFQLDQLNFNSNDELNYFIVSTKFLESWRDFCMSHEPQRPPPLRLNSDLLDPTTLRLRPNLKQKQDFELVTQRTYALFNAFPGTPLPRTAVKLGNQKRIPIYLNTYQYVCITNYDLKQIDMKNKRRNDFTLKSVDESENATVNDLSNKIATIEQNELAYTQRLWRVDKQQNLDTLFHYLKTAADRATNEYRIKGFGKKLQPDTRIEDLQMEEGDFFVVEVKDNNKRWFLQSDSEKKCEGCYDVTELRFPCPCEKVAYCTEACKEKDKKFHLRMCEYAEMEELNKSIDMTPKRGSQQGLVGLRNLGNTCFMNSCLQCLSNTAPLTRYFLQSCFQHEVNRTNPLGTKGKLAKSYAKFIKGMWCESDTVYVPDGVKSAVSSINHIFSGYAQHDSHQFFSFLIDGLHQDLNRVPKKPYVESPDSNNRPDSEVALQSWLDHTRRNQSVITDLMTGQYKSKVTCPSCDKQCITFDPFITVTLPIPQKVVNTFTCFVIFTNFEKETKRVAFSYSKPNVEEWTQNIARLTETDPKSLKIYLISAIEGIYPATPSTLADFVSKMQNDNKIIFAVQLTQEQTDNDSVQLTGRFSKKITYSNQNENLWFKFPFFFPRQDTTGLTVYRRMLRFIYNEAYNESTNRAKHNAKAFEDYETLMLGKRPFEIFVRYGKRVDKFYRKSEFKFEKEIQLTDTMTLAEVLTKVDEKDCELDMRMNKESMTSFNFERLKEFEDLTKKYRNPSYSLEDKEVALESCFETLSETEQLQAGNEWYCPVCKQHKLATKQMSIYKAPKILILHLKRFKQKGIYRKQKNESKVLFPLTLDMRPHLLDPTPFSSYAQQAKNKGVHIQPKYPQASHSNITASPDPIYDLYAVSNHYGGLGGGHYTAFAKNSERWYDFNDSSVRSVSEASIVGSGAYILFYSRRE